MDFEYDERKSQSNFKKHAIDFEAGKELWADLRGIVIDARVQDEVRYAIIVKIESKVWTGVYTIRNKKIRIISIRRSRKREVELYES